MTSTPVELPDHDATAAELDMDFDARSDALAADLEDLRSTTGMTEFATSWASA